MPLLPHILEALFSRLGRCPGEQQLAEYADQQLVGDQRHSIERHLAACNECLRQVGFLVRSNALSPEAPPETLSRTARTFVSPMNSTSNNRSWRPALGTTAVIVLSAVVAWRIGDVQPSVPAFRVPQTATEAKATPATLPSNHGVSSDVRGTRETPADTLISPTANATVSAKELEFRWRPVGTAEYYEIEVVTANGDLVWEKSLQNTSIKLPAAIQLTPGESYYVWLRVHSRRSGVFQTQTVRFTAG